jgi:diacylglycerol kinase family enzyme
MYNPRQLWLELSFHQSNISVIPILIDVHGSAGIICVGGDGIVNEVIYYLLLFFQFFAVPP